MLEVALLLREAIEEYFVTYGESDIERDHLDTDEWRILGEIKSFLGVLKSSTKSLEGFGASLDRVLPSMDFILAHFEKAKHTYKDDVKIAAMVNSGWQKMDKYYGKSDESPAYAAALFLNPARKWSYIEQFWRPSWQEKAKEGVKKLWEDEYKPKSTTSTAPTLATPSTNEFELWLRQIDTPTTVADEYDHYCKVECVYGYDNALDWWLEPAQQKSYPNLSRMALDILSLPAMSSDPERAFSAAKITLSDRRNKMGIQMIEYLECLKSWTGPLEWELEVKDLEPESNPILIGPGVVEVVRDTVEANL